MDLGAGRGVSVCSAGGVEVRTGEKGDFWGGSDKYGGNGLPQDGG